MGEINKDSLQKALAGPLRFLTRLTSPGATGNPKMSLDVDAKTHSHEFHFPLPNQSGSLDFGLSFF